MIDMVECIPNNHSNRGMMKTEPQKFPDVITLNVGGHHFVTKRSTLTKDSESMLAVMFSGRHKLDKDSEGRYFIDRDGAYFSYILNFLRDGTDLPPPSTAIQVYKEAQFYQVQSLIDRLERYANVFALKLNNAKKSKLGDSFRKWKDSIITAAQETSMENLSSTGKVNLLSFQEQEKLLECSECIGQLDHSLVISKPNKDKFSYHQQSHEYVRSRLRKPDLLLDISKDDMELFVRLVERELSSDGYTCRVWREEIKCKNVRMLYGIGREECEFNITEYFVEFEWPTPKSSNTERLLMEATT